MCRRACAAPPPAPSCTAVDGDLYAVPPHHKIDCCAGLSECVEQRDPADPISSQYPQVHICRRECAGASPPPPRSNDDDGTCIAEWSSCHNGGSCCGGLTCFRKDEYYSQCLRSCPSDRTPNWECNQPAAAPRIAGAPSQLAE